MPPRSNRLWFVLGALVLGGGGLLVLAAAVRLPGWLRDLVPGLGTALLIAGILGASVDQWLKQDLVRDAFHSVFGYMLPAELRGELSWVYGQELLCDRFELTLTLRLTEDPNLVTAGLVLSRDFRNVTTHKIKPPMLYAVDEWFHEGHPSQVISLHCTQGGTTRSQTEVEPSAAFIVAKRLSEEVLIKPDEHVTVVAEAEETKHTSDAWFLNMIFATANPRVTVDAPEGIAFSVMYGFNRQAGHASEIGRRTWQLPGTLLPGQVIQVRWWRDDAERIPLNEPS